MIKLKSILILLISTCFFYSGAQDIHFSQYALMPAQLNPAQTGNFNGDFRFAGIYRNQWASIPVPFNSTGFAFDMKAYESRKFNSFLGSGVYLHFDQAGDSRFSTFYAQIPLAYQVSLPLNVGSINLGAGLNIGWMRKSINTGDLYFDQQFTGEVFDPTLPTNENFEQLNFSNPDLGLGFLFSLKSGKGAMLSAGIGIQHLNKAQETFFNDGMQITLNRRFSLPVMVRFPVRDKWELQLDYLYQEQGPLHEMLFGAMTYYYFQKDLPAKKAISFGTYGRTKDAFIAILQYHVNQFTAGISYDVNISRLNTATNTYGAFELGAVYIITKVKDPVIKNNRQCFVF